MLMQKSFLLGTTFRDNGEFLKECSFRLIDFEFLPQCAPAQKCRQNNENALNRIKNRYFDPAKQLKVGLVLFTSLWEEWNEWYNSNKY